MKTFSEPFSTSKPERHIKVLTSIIRNIIFEEIEVDKGERVLERNKNERTVLEENEVIVLENSKKENEKILE
ncbi:11574_t:CDS:2, partial [Gigaspora margarita]